jgi:UPF0755 protein
MSDEFLTGPEDETPSEGAGIDRPPAQDRRPRRSRQRGARPAGRPQGRGRMPQTTRARKRRVGCLAALALVVVVAVGAAGFVWSSLYKPAIEVAPGQPVQIEVPKGASTAEIGELLAGTGVVANPLMFRLQQRSSADTRPLKAGVYDLATGMSYDAALGALREGPVIQYLSFTVPEGWTLEQISARIQEKAGVPAAEFLGLASTGAAQFDYAFLADNKSGSLQGYLFPKTYRVKVGSSAKDIIDVMLKQFGKETAGLDLAYPASRGLGMHGVVTIASIIEREARVEKDRPLISSVIYNRLARDMKLEICATVQFVVGNKPRLLYSDLKVQSPYNTYIHKGLPPGPIASPGLASLQAAVAPAQTQYLYYVLTHKDGSHSFSKTSAEHLRYKAQAEKGLK